MRKNSAIGMAQMLLVIILPTIGYANHGIEEKDWNFEFLVVSYSANSLMWYDKVTREHDETSSINIDILRSFLCNALYSFLTWIDTISSSFS